MESFYSLAIDMGAGSIRVILGNLSGSLISIEEIYRFKNEIYLENGSERWNINDIYSKIKKGIRIALKKNSRIKSIGIDSWGVDYVLLDSSDKLRELPFAYRDSRTNGMEEKWKTLMSGFETFRRTGINFYPFNTLLQLLSLKDEPSLTKADSLLFIPNYIYFKLTGIKFNEVTIASTSQVLNVNSNQFDESVLEKLNLNSELFARVVDPGVVIGNINDDSLPANIMQATSVCSHDTASAAVAIPSIENRILFLATGTWCILGIESQTPILTKDSFDMEITNERGFDNSYLVIKNIIGLWLIQGIQKALPRKISFAELEKMASEAAETGHLVDPDDACFYKPDNMISSFDDYFKKTNQTIPNSIGEYIKCAYNSLSLEFFLYIKKFEEISNYNFGILNIIGGGSQSINLCQSTSNFTQKKVKSGPVESAAIGNIIVQGIAMKQIKNLKEGRDLVSKSFPQTNFQPKISQQEAEETLQKFILLKNKSYDTQ